MAAKFNKQYKLSRNMLPTHMIIHIQNTLNKESYANQIGKLR